MAKKKASIKDLVNALAKERGLEVTDIERISQGGVKGRLESGAGFVEAFTETGKEKIRNIKETFSKEGVKKFGKSVYKEFFKGDDIFSAYARGRLAKTDRKKNTVAPEIGKTSELGKAVPTLETGKPSEETVSSGVSRESAEHIQILAENTMSIPDMARDVNVLRQNLQELVKIWGDKGKKPASKADIHHRTEEENRKRLASKVEKIRAEDVDYFAEQDKKEAELEAARQKAPISSATGKEEKKAEEKPSSLLDTILSMFSGGLLKAVKFLFNPRFLLKILGKVFVPLVIIGTLFSGIMDGFKRYQETGSFSEAIMAGLGGMLEFLTFGLFGEETVKKIFDSISDFFKPVIETITNIFTGIKDFFVKLFGGQVKVEDKEPPKAKDVTPQAPSGTSETPAGAAAPAATPSGAALGAAGTTTPAGEATPSTAPTAAAAPAPSSSEMTGTVSTPESAKPTTPTPSTGAAASSEMAGTVSPTAAPATAAPAAKTETAPAKVEPVKKAPEVDQHQLAVNLQNLRYAEEGLKFIYKDYLETKSRAKEGLLREGRKFSDDPNSKDYPFELQSIDEQYEKKIKGQEGKIEHFKKQPGVKEYLKQSGEKEEKFVEEKKEAETPTIKAEETGKAEESTKPEKVGGSEYTTGNKVETVSDGAQITVKTTTPDAKKAQDELKELDERQAKEREEAWQIASARGRLQGGRRHATRESDFEQTPELKKLKTEQEAERAALVKRIEEGTVSEVKKQAPAASPPPAEEKPSGGGGGGGVSLAKLTSDKGGEEKSAASGGAEPSEKPTEEKPSGGGGGAGSLESLIGTPSSAKAAEEEKKIEEVDAAKTAAAAEGVSPTQMAASATGGGVSGGQSPGGGSPIQPPITTPSEEASAKTPQLESPTQPKIPPGDTISKTSTEVAEEQRMESAADQGTTINAPTTNNTSTGAPQQQKTKADDVYDSELADRLAYS